jgi:hypothetical protein
MLSIGVSDGRLILLEKKRREIYHSLACNNSKHALI